MPPDEPTVLEYGRREPKRSPPALAAAAVGAALGGAAAWFSLAVLSSGGPIVPLLLLLSPLSLLAEAIGPPDELFRPLVGVGGPVLYALYAVLLTRRPRKWGAIIVVVAHVLCIMGALMLK